MPGESVGSASGWAAKTRKGTVRLEGQVPRDVAQLTTPAIRHHARGAELKLSFAFPLRDKAGLDRLIAQQAKTHQLPQPSRDLRELLTSAVAGDALRNWLVAKGFTVTHVGADRLALTAIAPTTTVEKVLHTRIDDFVKGRRRSGACT